ncbi:MAG: fructose-1,6-bisphosphatase [Eggerthellaceae bacterium]|jgi:fructose-1,6-bisphosphatase-3
MDASEPAYLDALSCLFPTPEKAAAGITERCGALNLPRYTELYVSDVHGEYEEFSHLMRNGCGTIRRDIDAVFGTTLPEPDKDALATLVYYPGEKLACETARTTDDSWYAETIAHLLSLFAFYAQRHTPAQVRRALGATYSDTVLLMLHDPSGSGAASYQADLISKIISLGYADELVKVLADAIRHLAVGRLHLVGDIFDRGPAPDLIIEELMRYPSLDIQWGNHDIVWMGAALGQTGCIAHVVRNCARYGNLSILTDAYGINILPLVRFALLAYGDDPCIGYGLKGEHPELSPAEADLNVKIQKAMAILQFKVEAKLIDDNPSFGLEDRKLLHRIDWDKQSIVIDGIEYPLTDPVFPTVDPHDPYRLTSEEQAVMDSLVASFTASDKLKRHIRFLLDAGSLYTIANNTLLFHACVPLNADGSLKEVELYGKTYRGKALFDAVDTLVRQAFAEFEETGKSAHADLLWYLWLGQGSPLFAKSKMATFEIYLVADKAARKEEKNPFYSLLESEETLDRILADFGLDPKDSRIVCGHVPVKVKNGEDPVKCGGKALIIDGGMSHAYQDVTGVAGFTLVADEGGIRLATHQPFAPRTQAIAENIDLTSTWRTIEAFSSPATIADTDEGARLSREIDGLQSLLGAYRDGRIKPRKECAPRGE